MPRPTRATTSGNRLAYDGTRAYHYDSDGNVTSKVGPNDTTAFTFDYRNRLVKAKRTSTSGTAVDDVFTYDVWDRQIGQPARVEAGAARCV